MLKAFVSYAKEDSVAALEFASWLASIGTNPWIDQRELLPGQNWEAEIERAFNDANVVVLLMSPRSVSKRGFVQREANEALQKLSYKLPTDVYVIPVMLETCDVPSHVSSRVQYIDWRNADARSKIAASLAVAAEQQSLVVEEGAEIGPFRVLLKAIAEEWNGYPGHDIAVSYPKFMSATHSAIAEELNQYFEGRARAVVLESRQKAWDQDLELFKDRDWARSNGRWDDYQIAYASGRVLSVVYNVGTYGAGAAHPNSYFETHNFALAPHLTTFGLDDIFEDINEAIPLVSEICTAHLRREYWQRFGEEADESQMAWFLDGAGPKAENFSKFSVSDELLTFLFAPYAVSAYAAGSWSVSIPLYDLLQLLKKNGPFNLLRPALDG